MKQLFHALLDGQGRPKWSLSLLLLSLFLLFASTAMGLVEFNSLMPGVRFTTRYFMDAEGALRLPAVFYSVDFYLMLASGLVLAILLPVLNPIGASLLVGLMAIPPVSLAITFPLRDAGVPMQFNLLVLLVMFGINMLIHYFGETRERNKLLSTFAQFVPPQVVGLLNDQTSRTALAGESRFLTVFFCDLRNFTSMSEQLDPREVVKLLNEYFTVMTGVLYRTGATIDKYMGDSIMAFWGAPVPQEDHVQRAVQASFEMHEHVQELADIFHARGLPTPSIGVGINSGVMNVGNMGSQYRLAYTVIGDAVNLAFRLQSATREYLVPTIVGEGSASRCPDMTFRELDTVAVKGKSLQTRIYQPICRTADLDDATRDMLEQHRIALAAWYDQDRERARKLFGELAQQYPDDHYFGRMASKAAERRGQLQNFAL